MRRRATMSRKFEEILSLNGWVLPYYRSSGLEQASNFRDLMQKPTGLATSEWLIGLVVAPLLRQLTTSVDLLNAASSFATARIDHPSTDLSLVAGSFSKSPEPPRKMRGRTTSFPP